MSERGQYIVIEGSDGTGKTTVANLVAEELTQRERKVLRVDEPDSAFYYPEGEAIVPVAAELRRIIKDGSLARTAFTNILLFTAARHENWVSAIRPALTAGIDVVSARNYWSTLVYQGYAEGYDQQFILDITRQANGEQYMNPDQGFILDLVNEEERQRRIANRGELEKPDTFESRGDGFQQKLRSGYRDIAKKQDLPLVDVDGKTPPQVSSEVLEAIFSSK